MNSQPTWDFYHRIADKECAETRQLLSRSGWIEKGLIRFRNIDTGPEALASLKTVTGKDQVPVLHNTLSGEIYSGKTAIQQKIDLVSPE